MATRVVIFDVRHTVLGLNSACIRTGIVIRCNHTRIATTSVLIPHAVHSEHKNFANRYRGTPLAAKVRSLFIVPCLPLANCCWDVSAGIIFLLIALLTGALTYQGLPFNGARGEEEEV